MNACCTISGNTCSEADGAVKCSCVGCTSWRMRHAVGLRAIGAASKIAEFALMKDVLGCTNVEMKEILDGGRNDTST